MDRQSLAKFYFWVIIAAGVLALGYTLTHLQPEVLGLRFALIALVTLFFGSRIYVRIPRVNGDISISDTFIFLALLIFGGEAAVLLAAADALITSIRITKSKLVIAFNAAVYVCSTFLTIVVLRAAFGDIQMLPMGNQSAYITAVCVMALVQYAINSGLIAIGVALRAGKPIWQMWRQNFLWTSITYFAGASAAGIIVKLIESFGLYALLASAPIIVVVYFTYVTYLKNVEASEAQAEQARRHVEELNRYIAEQDRIHEQFIQIEKMSALGQLASGVAHNFNNMLTSVRTRAELMLERAHDAETKRGLEIILRSVEDSAKTVRRIQDFARQGPDNDLEPVLIDQLLLDVAELTRPRWKNSAEAQNIHIKFRLELSPDVRVIGSASELREVLINLIFNAVDAMPNGGQITLGSEVNRSSAIISVRDTGIGMSPEVRSRIFDPFFTTKVEGMGLGLAVSYGIIRRQGGTIDVESDTGHGTVFQLILPSAGVNDYDEKEAKERRVIVFNEEEVQLGDVGRRVATATSAGVSEYHKEGNGTNGNKTITSPVSQQDSSSPVRILIIDDDALVLSAFRDILEVRGYSVATADSGSQSMEVAKDFCPDIILADNNMPGMNGLQTLQALRAIAPDSLAIMITGYADISVVTEALRQFVFDFLLKPISLVDLNQSIQRAILYRQMRERERRQRDFLSIVSHELRAPLQAPLRDLENLSSGVQGPLTEKQHAVVQRVKKGIKTEVRLVNNLLDLQFLESGRFRIRPQRHSLREVVKEVIDTFLLHAADSKVHISWNPSSDPFVVEIDSEQIKQAIGNILYNAIQHTPAGKGVRLKLFNHQDTVCCTVRDEGVGIAQAYLERIFEKSFQVPSAGMKKGLGIGLYIAREIIQSHGGDIYVKSKLDVGSLFIITLPKRTNI